MAELKLGKYTVETGEDGYMTNPDQWNKEIAEEIAKQENIKELTPDHWNVIEFLQKDYKEKGSIPTIRRLKKVGGIDTKELYKLFPEGPVKKAARIAGLPKPKSCV
ncbi:sulfur relay protein DsrC [candidate division KSB1 bacterium]|nr:MAG: sulfur relay protein DsrC [candidate division KSB1 bacterium]